MTQISGAVPNGDDDTFFQTLRTLWTARWQIMLGGFGFGLIGVVYALLATPWFQASVVMLPASTPSMAAGLSQLGGLAGIVGINLSTDAAEQEPLAVLRSSEFAASFIEQQQLMPILFESDWDSAAKSWKEADPADQPDIRDAVRIFNEQVRAVSEDNRTGIVTLSITWKDPELAAEWANLMVNDLNARLRRQSLAEAEHNVEFLKKELASTSVAPLQQSISSLLETEMQKMLVARGRDEFAFKVIDRAVVPKERVRPKRTMIVLFCGMLGGALVSFLVFLRSALRGRNWQAL